MTTQDTSSSSSYPRKLYTLHNNHKTQEQDSINTTTKLIVTHGGEDGIISYINDTNNLAELFTLEDTPLCVALSETNLAVGLEDGSVLVFSLDDVRERMSSNLASQDWNSTNLAPVTTLPKASSPVRALAFYNTNLAVGSETELIYYDITTQVETFRYAAGMRALTVHETKLAGLGMSGHVHVFDKTNLAYKDEVPRGERDAGVLIDQSPHLLLQELVVCGNDLVVPGNRACLMNMVNYDVTPLSKMVTSAVVSGGGLIYLEGAKLVLDGEDLADDVSGGAVCVGDKVYYVSGSDVISTVTVKKAEVTNNTNLAQQKVRRFIEDEAVDDDDDVSDDNTNLANETKSVDLSPSVASPVDDLANLADEDDLANLADEDDSLAQLSNDDDDNNDVILQKQKKQNPFIPNNQTHNDYVILHWNHIGHLTLIDDVIILKTNTHTTKLANHEYTAGVLGESGVVLVNRAGLVQSHTTAHEYWSTNLADDEYGVLAACGACVCVVTSANYLRVWSGEGVTSHVVALAKQVLTLTARANLLVLYYMDGSYEVYRVTSANLELMTSGLVPLQPKHLLTWCGITEDGVPLIMTSYIPQTSSTMNFSTYSQLKYEQKLYMLVPLSSSPARHWVPLTIPLDKPVTPISTHQDQLLYLPTRTPATHMITSKVPLRVPLAAATSDVSSSIELEEVYVRASAVYNAKEQAQEQGLGLTQEQLEEDFIQIETQLDKVSLKLFHGALEDNKVKKAVSYLSRILLEKSLDLALTIADSFNYRNVSQQIEYLREKKFGDVIDEDEDDVIEEYDNSDVEEEEQQQFTASITPENTHKSLQMNDDDFVIDEDEEVPTQKAAHYSNNTASSKSTSNKKKRPFNPFMKMMSSSPKKQKRSIVADTASPSPRKSLNRQSTFSEMSRARAMNGKRML